MISINTIDIEQLPENETQSFEYKSSRTSIDKLKTKMTVAASAFTNAGGGFFIAGVNDQGKADGGFPKLIGRQTINDWIDQVLNLVHPFPKYNVRLIERSNSNELIDEEKVVIIIQFEESSDYPVMAMDLKYYLRLGAHSDPVNHFVLEALRSKRFSHDPKLLHKFRLDEKNGVAIVLDIINTTNQAALNVAINFEPDLPFFDDTNTGKSIEVPVITKEHPFTMTVGFYHSIDEDIGTDTNLVLSYESEKGSRILDSVPLKPLTELPPVGNIRTSLDKISASIEKIEKTFTIFTTLFKNKSNKPK